MVRPGSRLPTVLAPLRNDLRLIEGDLLDFSSLRRAVHDAQPDELYHLAAPTFVPASWNDPTGTMAAIAGATGTLLAAVATQPSIRFYLAGSSEVFGDAGESPQHEGSPMRPRTPYGVAKLAAFGLVRTMRERHGLHASVGILYNHESPRRPENFVTRKITAGVAAIARGDEETLELGSLDAVRDWCHAADVARAAALAVRAHEPGDYVIASGRGRTVNEFVDAAFAAAGIARAERVVVNPAFVRPIEDTQPVGDPRLAAQVLGWRAEIGFDAMVAEMVDEDVRR